jgi:hypothetical protein
LRFLPNELRPNVSFRLKRQTQRQLNLSWSIRARGLKKIHRVLIIGREATDSNSFVRLSKLRPVTLKTVVSNREALIVTIKKIERLDNQIHFETRAKK